MFSLQLYNLQISIPEIVTGFKGTNVNVGINWRFNSIVIRSAIDYWHS